MYSIKDYLLNGVYYANNIIRPHHKRLTSLMIYATSRCQSRCKHCQIWKKAKEDLMLKDIKRIMASHCIDKNTTVGLEGGEFVLHPQADEILDWFHQNHPNFTLLSNCLAPDRVIEMTKRYHPRHLYVSLDGNRETYKYMRGVDGHDKVIKVVEELRDELPLSLMFCLSPWNTMQDMEYCIGLALNYGIDIRIGIYGTMAFFDTTAEMMNDTARIPDIIRKTSENYDFVKLYDNWRKGELRLPCHSIRSQLVIHPDGTVPICQNLDVTLGNIHQQSLDEIFNSENSCKLQHCYGKNCNKCWINYHRKYDIIILRNLERFLPKRLIESFYGKYQWSKNEKWTYRKTIGQ